MVKYDDSLSTGVTSDCNLEEYIWNKLERIQKE